MSNANLLFYGITDMGRKRTNNEDAFVAEQLDETSTLAVVIDGVGGYEGGEIAAEIAQKEIPAYLKEFTKGDRLELLKQAVVSANNTIFEHSQADHNKSNMCCVLTSVIVDTTQKIIYMAHVGDTRLYQFNNRVLDKLSHDHSDVGYREEIGNLTEEQAMQHPRRNEINRVVGSERHEVSDYNFIEAEQFLLLPNSTYLLCSDGLTDLVTSEQIGNILQQETSIKDKSQNLITAANNAGGKDNITVILIEYNESEDTAPKHEIINEQTECNNDIESQKTAEQTISIQSGLLTKMYISIICLLFIIIALISFLLIKHETTVTTISKTIPQEIRTDSDTTIVETVATKED